jgi:hypothetical protein
LPLHLHGRLMTWQHGQMSSGLEEWVLCSELIFPDPSYRSTCALILPGHLLATTPGSRLPAPVQGADRGPARVQRDQRGWALGGTRSCVLGPRTFVFIV